MLTKLNETRSRGIEHCPHAHSSSLFILFIGCFLRSVAVFSPLFLHFYLIFTVSRFNRLLCPPFIKSPTSFYFFTAFPLFTKVFLYMLAVQNYLLKVQYFKYGLLFLIPWLCFESSDQLHFANMLYNFNV